MEAQTVVICPQCGSKKVWRDGLRLPMFGEPIQRWLCRDCGFRFSHPTVVKRSLKAMRAAEMLEGKTLKSGGNIVSSCQIGVLETKNLVAEPKTIVVPQKSERDIQSLEGAIVDFLWMLKKENKAEVTIENYGYSLRALVAVGVDLFKPESFIDTIALQTQWTNTRKYGLSKAYRCFLNHHSIEVKLPKFKPSRSLPYIPPEDFLDQLIACCSHVMGVLFQTLKETAARPVEALRLEWDDLDVANKRLSINHPAKGSNVRMRPISDKLLNMLMTLPKDGKRIFAYKSADSAGRSYRKMRKRAIKKLGNSELRKIDFYTCRYWRATLEYQRTRDFGAVMLLLGHTSLRYVLLYAQLSETHFGDKGYVCKEAHNRHQAMQLIELGFEYVMIDNEGVSLFRKIK